ncbi:MAG: hypothetical protein D6732_25210 [Methanobacteriota archaeon]|nr:MAG: hypothetical protein D6732_25210 [Euryarchaeota archaeon]
MRELEQVILERGKSLGLRGNTVQELQSSINRLQEVVERHREQVSTIEERVSFLARTCKHLQEDRLKEVNQRIQQSREQIQQIEATRNLDDFEAYRKRLDEKMHLESRLQQAMAILRNYYGEEGDTLSQKVAYWQNRISELAEYQKVSQSIVFHEKELEKKKAQYGKIQAELEEIRKEMQQFQERLKAIEHKAAEVFIDEAPICRTVTDLENVHHRLKNFLQEIETRQERIRTAIQIFDEIEMEEKGKVGNLFGKNSAVSRLYDRVTRGLYQSVQYDPQENRILVERSDGSILSPEMLSGGAYDQLYFTIRIAFAEKLFPEEKGFFIFDDPFLKSDKERLQQELKLLLDFAQKGWQIIYFTAKDEIKEVLEPQIGSGDVVMHKVGGVLFKSERISR